MATTIIDYFSTLHPRYFSKDVFAHLESMSPDLKVISCVSRVQRNENRLQWDGRLSRPAPGLNLAVQASVFISTVWLTVAVSCIRRGGFTDLAAVCRDTELPPPLLHSVQSTQLIGGTGPPRSLTVSE